MEHKLSKWVLMMVALMALQMADCWVDQRAAKTGCSMAVKKAEQKCSVIRLAVMSASVTKMETPKADCWEQC